MNNRKEIQITKLTGEIPADEMVMFGNIMLKGESYLVYFHKKTGNTIVRNALREESWSLELKSFIHFVQQSENISDSLQRIERPRFGLMK
jgi:hypothetical protein